MRYFAAIGLFGLFTQFAYAIDCEKFIKVHGFLSRAQFQCNFNKYSSSVLQQAKECSAHLSEARVEESLRSGMALFDEREKERGHNKMCADILKSFPNQVAR